GAVLRPDWSLVVEPGPSLPATIDGDPMFQYTSSMSTDLDISFPDEIADAAPPEPPPDLPPGMPSELELSPVPGLPGGEDVED
ncbi:MAG: hypothetical protein FJ098_08585, partial [Deltaproteobacteria bacterium]|nr:hypothetical protein [Deltaproteobacteria bacterium]